MESFLALMQKNVFEPPAVVDLRATTAVYRDMDREDLPPQTPTAMPRQAHSYRVRDNQPDRTSGLNDLTPRVNPSGCSPPAAATALNIMREGPSMHLRFYCPQLVSAAFDLPTAQ